MATWTWTCENCVFQFNGYRATICAICGSMRSTENDTNVMENKLLITGYLTNTGFGGQLNTEINDIEAKKKLDESHIQTIICTFGYVREWENEKGNQNYQIPAEITRMIADYGKKVEEKRHIGDLVTAFLQF